MKIIATTGGRDYADEATVDRIMSEEAPSVVLVGDATGADALVTMWCIGKKLQVHVFCANWTELGKRAGPVRNGEMLRSIKPAKLIAFPGGKGTADCVRQARALGIEVREIPVASPAESERGE